jgi:hypothetical protein
MEWQAGLIFGLDRSWLSRSRAPARLVSKEVDVRVLMKPW